MNIVADIEIMVIHGCTDILKKTVSFSIATESIPVLVAGNPEFTMFFVWGFLFRKIQKDIARLGAIAAFWAKHVNDRPIALLNYHLLEVNFAFTALLTCLNFAGHAQLPFVVIWAHILILLSDSMSPIPIQVKKILVNRQLGNPAMLAVFPNCFLPIVAKGNKKAKK